MDKSIFFTSDLTVISDQFTFLEGPVWHKDGYLLFSDIPNSTIHKYDPKCDFSVWRTNTGQSNGLALDAEGSLIACEHQNRRVSYTARDGQVLPLATHYRQKRLNSPNDCIVRTGGWVYFTDPPYGITEEQKEQSFNGVFRGKPGMEPILLTDELDRPNGLAFTPDESHLLIADTQKECIYKFVVDSAGDIHEKTLFCTVGRPDGIKFDTIGNLFVASTEGIVVFDSQGDRLAVFETPKRPANLAFGGEDYKTLYIMARTDFYSIRVANSGLPVRK